MNCPQFQWTHITIESCLYLEDPITLTSATNSFPFRSQPFKSKIIDLATKEGENWIGCGMTYTLFECLKEQITELLDELEEEVKNAAVLKVSEDIRKVQLAPVISTGDTQAPVKKEQMTKNQKRRLWDRSDNKGNKQRGWDWVCLIRHLSQGGQREDVVPTPQQSTQSSSQLAPPPNNY